LELTPDAVVITNRSGQIVLVNGQAESLFGYLNEELVGQAVEMLVPLRHRLHHTGHRVRYAGNPRVRSMGAGLQLFGLRKDGSEFPVDISLSPLETNAGLLVTSAIRDVTERERVVDRLRKSEDLLRRREAQLADAQAMAHLGSWERDVVSGTVEWSDEMYRIHGLRPGETDSVSPRRLAQSRIHRQDRDLTTAFSQRLSEAPPGTEAVLDYRVIHRDGTIHWLRAKARITDDGQGRRVRGMVQDITEQKRLQELTEAARKEAERANEAKTAFLTSMSHDLRTPLNSILGYAGLLLGGLRGPVSSGQVEALNRMERAAKHQLGLINDLLNFAKLRGSQVGFAVTDARVSELLANAGAMIEPQASAKGILLTFVTPAPTLAVHADPERVMQILLNLLSNAIKFTDSGGRVTLAAGFDRRRCSEDATAATGSAIAPAVQITVSDAGRGIPAGHLETIFEPFVQVGRRLEGTDAGTGLGLAISRDLARAMGGDLTVESTPGVGSAFTLTLPSGQIEENGSEESGGAESRKWKVE
jgi:PAS domain S-box-containing protein